MKVKPVLGDWEIPRIESIRTLEQRSFAELSVPGRTGSLFHDLNTVPTRIVITGSLFGDEARDDFLQQVRGKFQDSTPVTFVADIITATKVQYVLIETLHFAENATRPDQIDYVVVLKESPPPPPPPDPLGGLDAGLLDQAGNFLDSVTGALDAVKMLGDIPDIHDPTPPVKSALDGVKAATTGLDTITNNLKALFGT